MLVLCMYVQPKMVKCFSPFFPQQQFEQTIIFQSRGFEPYGMVSWPQEAVVAPPPPFPDFFLAFLRIFQNYSCTLGGKKAKLTFVSFFPFFLCTFPYLLSWSMTSGHPDQISQRSPISSFKNINCTKSRYVILRNM